MQTYRECMRGFELNFANEGPFTCSQPLIFADLVLAVGDNQLGVLQKAGASRIVTFAGCHGDLKYGVQICPGETLQGAFGTWRVYSALMVLPLAENSLIAPAVLPNIANSRSMLSVVTATQSDSERRILWYRMDKLTWLNVQDGAGASQGCGFSGTGVTERLDFSMSVAAAIYGRTLPSIEAFRVKARARLTERDGLFLVRNVVADMETTDGVFLLESDCYLRFAVK